MASTGLKLAFGALIGVTALGALQSVTSGPAEAAAESQRVIEQNRIMLNSAAASAEKIQPIQPTKEPEKANQMAQLKMSDLPPMDEVDKMIGAVINLNGYLCARPIEVREAGTGLYGVRCITRRDGTGISDYLVNSRTSKVEPI